MTDNTFRTASSSKNDANTNSDCNLSPTTAPPFVYTATATHAGHSIGITATGQLFTWGPSNTLGQLGRTSSAKIPRPVLSLPPIHRAYVGGRNDSGHTAALDTEGNIWLTGCDRWQQLGLGSMNGGAAGYTWSKVFQTTFQKNEFVMELLRAHDTAIRDVALGGDHTLILSSNQKDVIAFGKGDEGQLGLREKRFVSAPSKSKVLSSDAQPIAAVCAFDNCSFTLNNMGNVLNKAGKCKAGLLAQELGDCRRRAMLLGLLAQKEESSNG